MTSSASSTERPGRPADAIQPRRPADAGFRPWHFYILLSMAGATGAVMLARDTHPAALLLLSAAVVAAGLVGLAIHRALGGFLEVEDDIRTPLPDNTRENLEKEKMLALRAIKELEFDRAMRKVSERDYEDMLGRLRRRAMMIMQELERHAEPPKPVPVAAPAGVCRDCGTANEADARFCKQCGAPMAKGATA